MKKILVVLILFCAFFMISCGSDSSKPVSGGEDSVSNFGKLGSECYPNKTCDAGLLCDEESNLCIEDPENPVNDSDNSSEQTDDNTDTSSEQTNDDVDTTPDNDSDSGETNPDDTDSTPNNDADSGDSAPDSDDSDTTNENPSNLPECSPTSAVPCFDSATGLIWSGQSAEKMHWADAVNYCKNLNDGGYSDWRLPSEEVLGSLVQNCNNSSGCEGDTDGKYSKFGDIVFLWSSTGGSSTALGIYFFNSEAQWKSVDESFNVRCVRGDYYPVVSVECSPTSSTPCKDSSSGLIWSARSGGYMVWNDAINQCDNLLEGYYTDWRLPTISELRTLIQNCSKTETGGTCGVTDECLSYSECRNDDCGGCTYDENNPVQYSKFGDESWFWSSSTRSDNAYYAWYVDFKYGHGHVGYGNKTNDYYLYVRCVR